MIPARIREALTGIGPDDAHPLNLFRVHWFNGANRTDVVSVPVGFVSDHVELLYDIDVKARAVADEVGIRLERPPALNDDPVLIEALADLVGERAARWLVEAHAA